MFKATTVKFKQEFSRELGWRMGEELTAILGDLPDACWLFCASEKGLDELFRGVCESIGTKNLIGCTTDGEISSTGFSTGSAVLGGIVSDEIKFHITFAEHISEKNEVAGKRLAQDFPETISYIQLFSDGITGNGCAILRGITDVIGDQIPIAGGTAGDGGKFCQTLQFAKDRIFSDAAVAIGFSGKFKLGTGVKSGWSPIGLPKKVTRASGKVLYELNGEPALHVYERFLGRHADKLPAVGVEYPLGLYGRWGDVGEKDYFLLRATMSFNREDGSVSFAGEIPEGATVHLTCGDSASILKAARDATRQAMADLNTGYKYSTIMPGMIFCYSCMARKMVLGRLTREEFENIRREAGADVPIIGFYSYGEFCRVRRGGPSLLHNETITLSVLGCDP